MAYFQPTNVDTPASLKEKDGIKILMNRLNLSHEEARILYKKEKEEKEQKNKERLARINSRSNSERIKLTELTEEEKIKRSDEFYRLMNVRIHNDVPDSETILSHIIHPAATHIRTSDVGIGIFFVETHDGKIIRIHESKDRQTYGHLPRIETHETIEDAIRYCSYLVSQRGYYSVQQLDNRFPKGTIPTMEAKEQAQDEFVTWKQRGSAVVEVEEDIDF